MLQIALWRNSAEANRVDKQKTNPNGSFFVYLGCPSQPLFERNVMIGYKSLWHKAISHFL